MTKWISLTDTERDRIYETIYYMGTDMFVLNVSTIEIRKNCNNIEMLQREYIHHALYLYTIARLLRTHAYLL